MVKGYFEIAPGAKQFCHQLEDWGLDSAFPQPMANKELTMVFCALLNAFQAFVNHINARDFPQEGEDDATV